MAKTAEINRLVGVAESLMRALSPSAHASVSPSSVSIARAIGARKRGKLADPLRSVFELRPAHPLAANLLACLAPICGTHQDSENRTIGKESPAGIDLYENEKIGASVYFVPWINRSGADRASAPSVDP
jgi:hypothetical protein